VWLQEGGKEEKEEEEEEERGEETRAINKDNMKKKGIEY